MNAVIVILLIFVILIQLMNLLKKPANDTKSFENVINQLHQIFGELNNKSDNISNSITSLNNMFSNVKAKGLWGEMQLAGILANTMDKSQYEKDFKPKLNSNERVEFAVKFPAKEGEDKDIYLPIDSKFTQACNKKELENFIKGEANTISTKYINPHGTPPHKTTDFAIMFLPAESLYAEALSINGLAEYCWKNSKIIITGPSTITALLNTINISLVNLELNKKTAEIITTLKAVKNQFETLNELIDKTDKSLNTAIKNSNQMRSFTQKIQNSMANI